MAVELKSFPFDSIADDREYPASIFRKYFHKFLSTGIYFGKYKNYGDYSMKVVPSLEMNIRVTKGAGIIRGLDFELEEDEILPIELSLGKIRKDMVVIRADDTLAERKTILYIKQGTNIEFAELERTDDIYEICIARIIVGDTKANIELEDIEDTRRDTELAGIVTSLIDIDIQDVLDEITIKKEKFFINLGIVTEEEKEKFWNELDTWFKTIQDIIDENTAVHLLNLINTNTQAIEDNSQVISDTMQMVREKADWKKEYIVEIDTNWSEDKTKTVEVEGIEATDIVNIYPAFSSTKETRVKEKEEYEENIEDTLSIVSSFIFPIFI